MIPQGSFRGIVDGAGALTFAKSGNKGTENVQVRARFTKGPADVVGQTRVWFGYFSDGSWERTLEVLRYLWPEWQTDELADLRAISARTPQAIEVELVVEHETYEGKVREKLAWINVPRAFGEPMDDSTLAEFSRRWRPSVATVKPSTTAPPRAASTGNRLPGGRSSTDDFGDVPPPDDRDAPPPRGGTPFGGR